VLKLCHSQTSSANYQGTHHTLNVLTPSPPLPTPPCRLDMDIQKLPGLDHSVEEHREEHASQKACHTHNAGEQLREGEKIEKTSHYSVPFSL